MMYTVYDFINNDIEANQMKFGWKIEADARFITLKYDMLDFDWKSLDFVNNEIWNMFLNSTSYKTMMSQLDEAKKKFGRLYLDAYNINELKFFAEQSKLKVDIDSLISKTVARKSEKIKNDIKEKPYA